MRHQILIKNPKKNLVGSFSPSAKIMTRQIKILLSTLFIVLLFGFATKAQNATWNATGTLTGGYYQNYTEKSWFNPANWDWGASTPTANGIPDATTNVTIPSGQAVCWIPKDYTTRTAPELNTTSPLCLTLTIDGGALYNQGSRNTSSDVTKGLTVSGNTTIQNSAVYIGDAEIARIDGNISVDASSYMVMYGGLNVIELKGNYTNNGRLGKVDPKSDALTMDFKGATTSTLTIPTKTYVTGLRLMNPGTGYTSQPTVTVSGNATANAKLAVETVNVTASGTGYTSQPSVTFSNPPSGTIDKAQGYATMSLETITPTAGGSGYTDGSPSASTIVTISGGGGSGATATATVSGGAVTAINITNAGTGYTSVPKVTISGNGSGATATTITMKVTGVSVTDAGSNYTSFPTITFGSGAATASVTTMKLSGIDIASQGSGYGANPTVTISGGGGSGATATGNIHASNQLSPAIAPSTPYLYLDNKNWYSCAAFDGLNVNKDLPTANTYIVTNATSTPIVVGVTDGSGNIQYTNSGDINVNSGAIVVNNVATLAIGSYTTSDTHIWDIPGADINVRGDISIANETGSGATRSLAGISLVGTESNANNYDDYTLRVGGNLYDLNTSEPTNTQVAANEFRGLYIGGHLLNGSDRQDNRPFVIFDGLVNQNIQGAITALRDKDDVANEPTGIYLPEVVIQKPDSSTVYQLSGSATRIFGHLLIFTGIYNMNAQTLLFGDDANVFASSLQNTQSTKGDEINIFGTFQVTAGSTLKMSGGNKAWGTMMRVRKGGYLLMQGRASAPIIINRDAPDTEYYRMAAYSGSRLSVVYATFENQTDQNNDYSLGGTGVSTDNDNGGDGSRGGFKVYEGAVLETEIDHDNDPTTAMVGCFSYCSFTNGGENPGVCHLTINTGQAVNIYYPLFGGNSEAWSSTNKFANIAENYSGSAGDINVYYSSGQAGGINGECADEGQNESSPNVTGTACTDEGNIHWIGQQALYWWGATSTAWNDPTNWSTSDLTRTPNPAFVPGTAGNEDYNIYILTYSDRDVDIDASYTINGTFFNYFDGGAPKNGSKKETRRSNVTVTLNANTLTIGNDFINMGLTNGGKGGIFNANTGTLNVAANFLTEFGPNGGSSDANAVFNPGTSTVVLNGTGNQFIKLRTNDLYNLTIDKTSGIVGVQGLSGPNFYFTAAIQNNLYLKKGIFGPRSTTPLVVQGNFTQDAGTFDMDLGPIVVQGDYVVNGGESFPLTSRMYFTPNNTTARTITTGDNHTFNEVYFNKDEYVPETGHNNATSQTPAGGTFATIEPGDVTYNLTENFEAISTIKVQSNRLVNMTANKITKTISGDFTIESSAQYTMASGAELLLAPDKTFLVDGRFDMVGGSGSYCKVSRSGAGTSGKYAFTVNGIISARYYLCEFMDDAGLNLTSTSSSVSPGNETVGGGGSGYTDGSPSASTTVTIAGGGGNGASFTANVSSGVVTGYNLVTAGSGYILPPVVSVGGTGSGATAGATLTATTLGTIVVADGGTLYTDGDPSASTTVTITGGGATTDATATAKVVGGIIQSITITSPGVGYTSQPTISIGGTGSGGQVIGYLTPTSIASLSVPTEQKFAAATFSDGIFTNTSATGTALTIDENYNTYRTTNPSGVTWDYTATISATAGPRIDTIYNCIFPLNPNAASSTPKNVTRTGTTADATKRIIFKDALGAFAGESYDTEAAVTLAAGSPNNFLNPDGIQDSDSMVIWREPNIKRWDGGPTNAGTSWATAENWFPDGVPGPTDNVLINFDKVGIQFNNADGPPDLITPAAGIVINMDEDPSLRPITCRSLTIETLMPSPNPSSSRKTIHLQIDKQMAIIENMSMSQQGTITINNSADFYVGGSWSNEGDFNSQSSGTVNFNQPFTRVVNATADITSNANPFYNLTFSSGTTELNSDIGVAGNLSLLNSGTKLNPSNNFNTIYIQGNWINTDATFDPLQGTVNFGGASLADTDPDDNFPFGSFAAQTIDKTSAGKNRKEDFYDLVFDKGDAANTVTLNTRVEASNSLALTQGLVNSSADKELILGVAAQKGYTRGTGFINGPMGRLYVSDGALDPREFPIGKDYFAGDAAIFNLNIDLTQNDDGDKVLFVAEQFNTAPATGRVIPTSNPNNLNYVSVTQHWVVQQKPYPQFDDTYPINSVTSGRVELDKGTVSLPYMTDKENTITTAPSGTYVVDYTITEIPSVSIFKDPGNAANTAEQAQRGTGALLNGAEWTELENFALGNVNVQLVSSSNQFTSLGDGTFTLAWQFTALPVDLLRFNGNLKEEQVLLDWTTINEKDVAYFEVQRSTDGVHFTSIGNVTATGNNKPFASYEFIDHSPEIGVNYYRLKQIDNNKIVHDSRIIQVDVASKTRFTAYPNPVVSGGSVQVNILGVNDESASVALINMQGQSVFNQRLSLSSNALRVPVSETLAKGVYILKVSTKEKVFETHITIH